MKKHRATVFIPIEMAHRELDGKLLLATELCKKGYVVKLGNKANVLNYLSISAGGIFLSIWSGHKKFFKLYSSLRKSNTKILAMDEESIVTMGDVIYSETRAYSQSLNELDIYLAFAERDAKIVEKSSSPKLAVHRVGNPRLDVLNYMSAYVKPDQQNNILFVSPFGFGNHYLGFKEYMQQLVKSQVIPQKYVDHYYNYGINQISNMHEFYELIRLCVEKGPKHLNCVYRPHPAENISEILDKLGHLNVKISQDLSLIDDLMRSRLVIHNFCTVGVEAKILGIPTLGFSPIMYNVEDEESVYKGAPFASSTSEALIEINRITTQDSFDFRKSTEFDFRDFTKSSFVKISESIDSLHSFEHKLKPSLKILTYLRKRMSIVRQNFGSNYFSHRVKILTPQHVRNRLLYFGFKNSYHLSSSLLTGLMTIKSL